MVNSIDSMQQRDSGLRDISATIYNHYDITTYSYPYDPAYGAFGLLDADDAKQYAHCTKQAAYAQQ